MPIQEQPIVRQGNDSKRYHRFEIGEQGDAIVGSVYIRKDYKLPDEVIVKIPKREGGE